MIHPGTPVRDPSLIRLHYPTAGRSLRDAACKVRGVPDDAGVHVTRQGATNIESIEQPALLFDLHPLVPHSLSSRCCVRVGYAINSEQPRLFSTALAIAFSKL